MADNYYTGKAKAIVQISRVTVSAYDAATTYSLTVNGISITAIAAGSAAATATALAAAWNASTQPYFSPVTASTDSSPAVDVLLTADEAGFPFTVTSSVNGGSGTISSVTDDAVATGPYHWNNADNWSTGSVPGNADNIFIALTGARLCWEIDRSGDSPAELWTRLSLRGDARVGLSFSGVATSADGDTVSSEQPEYRSQYLKAAITTVDAEYDPTVAVITGSGRLHIHNTAVAASITTIAASASAAADTTHPAVCLLFDDADADLYVTDGRGGAGVGVGNPGETATFGDLVVDDDTNVSRVFLGKGVTHSTVQQSGGTVDLDAAATMPAITIDNGTCSVRGTQAVTSLTVNGGTVICNTTGTISTLTQADGSVVDFHQSGRARTVTTWNYNGGQRRIDDYVTITNDNRSGRITETIG